MSEVDAVLAIPGGFPSAHYVRVIREANARGIATLFPTRTDATADALVTYGAKDDEVARDAARLVDKILRGAKAGELPIERPEKLRLVINLKTARKLNFEVSPDAPCSRRRGGRIGDHEHRGRRMAAKRGNAKRHRRKTRPAEHRTRLSLARKGGPDTPRRPAGVLIGPGRLRADFETRRQDRAADTHTLPRVGEATGQGQRWGGLQLRLALGAHLRESTQGIVHLHGLG